MTDPRPPRNEAVPPDPTAPASSSVELRRLDILFRVWLREGRVHPLMHLMRRYRTEPPS